MFEDFSMRYENFFFLCIVSISLLLYSCITERERSVQYRRIPDAKWSNSDTLEFDVFVPVGETSYNFSLLLRLNNDYDYLELPYSCEIENAFGYNRLFSGIVKIAEKAGDFNSFKGSYRQFSKEIAVALKLPLAGLYKVKLVPSTTIPQLRGVENVGLLSEPQTVLLAPPAANYPALPIEQPPTVQEIQKKEK